MGGGRTETDRVHDERVREFSERTWWQIDYGTDVAPGLLLMAAVLGS